MARLRKLARRPNGGVASPDLTDAKPHVSRLLADRTVVAQSLATGADQIDADSGEPDVSTTDDEDITDPLNPDLLTDDAEADPLTALGQALRRDHAGHNAVADMLRTAGLVHPRLGRALSYGRLGTTEPMAYVGLHVREQRGELRRYGRPRLSWSLVALLPNGEHWRVKAYVPKAHSRGGRTGWLDYTGANVAFRANRLPEGRRTDADFVGAVDVALAQLADELTGAAGYVLYVSGENARSLWARLANKNLEREPDDSGNVDGRPLLPGLRLPRLHRPRAIVRVTSGSSEIPRPVQVIRPKVVDGKKLERSSRPPGRSTSSTTPRTPGSCPTSHGNSTVEPSTAVTAASTPGGAQPVRSNARPGTPTPRPRSSSPTTTPIRCVTPSSPRDSAITRCPGKAGPATRSSPPRDPDGQGPPRVPPHRRHHRPDRP